MAKNQWGGWSDDHHISPSTFAAHPPTKENRAIKTSLQPIEVGKFLADCDTWTSFGRCRTPTLGVLAIGEKWCRAVDVSGRMYDRRKIQIPLYVKHLYIYIHLIWFVYIYKVHVFVSCMIVWFCVSTLCVHWCCDRCMDQPELCDATMRDHRWKSWTLSCIGSFPPSSSFIGVKDFQTISCLCSFELPTTKMTAVLIIRKGGYAMVPYHVSHGHKIR